MWIIEFAMIIYHSLILVNFVSTNLTFTILWKLNLIQHTLSYYKIWSKPFDNNQHFKWIFSAPFSNSLASFIRQYNWCKPKYCVSVVMTLMTPCFQVSLPSASVFSSSLVLCLISYVKLYKNGKISTRVLKIFYGMYTYLIVKML